VTRESKVSAIVTVDERPEPLLPFYREYVEPLRAAGYPVEFIFLSQPEHRAMLREVDALGKAGENVQVYVAAQHVSEATLLKLGAQHATGDILITMPAYRRIEASALPAMVKRVEDGVEVVAANRTPRRDPWINRLQSRLFHGMVAPVARQQRLHDIGAGVRVLQRGVLDNIVLYGDFARFLPVLALRDGYRVEEMDAPQHAADRRLRVYSPGVYLRRLVDLLGIFFLTRFTEKPLRFFGLIGSVIAMLGGVLLIVLGIQRIGGQGIANRPLLLLAVLLVVMGVQAIALGLVGEIIVHLGASRQRTYRIAPDSRP
jgi:hypothetical protein